MPTYGYRCTACGHEFERFQKMTEAPITECESCGGLVKKRVFPVGIQFVGSGFYVNDYTRKSSSSQENPVKSGEGKSETTETKSEAASETKTETTATKSETKTETAATKSETKTETAATKSETITSPR